MVLYSCDSDLWMSIYPIHFVVLFGSSSTSRLPCRTLLPFLVRIYDPPLANDAVLYMVWPMMIGKRSNLYPKSSSGHLSPSSFTTEKGAISIPTRFRLSNQVGLRRFEEDKGF
ncbi:hypothetical protein PanWU01x14_114330 [Parasponia andersonii]|uniref:Uncharacterized protein n=1 Tax=Parasponia andersonii TaxID=3476 RepID=A0A2P5CXB4_PARAD|nr:hypothetical protein PanWU01x14_114330 [Parasponia andersonii]